MAHTWQEATPEGARGTQDWHRGPPTVAGARLPQPHGRCHRAWGHGTSPTTSSDVHPEHKTGLFAAEAGVTSSCGPGGACREYPWLLGASTAVTLDTGQAHRAPRRVLPCHCGRCPASAPPSPLDVQGETSLSLLQLRG